MFPAATPDICDRVAGSATACREARVCRRCRARRSRTLGREAGLVLVFPAGDADPDTVVAEAQEAAGGALVAGMTGTAAIGADGLIQTGCSAIAFSSSLRAGVGAVEGGDPRTAGREAAAKALAESTTAHMGSCCCSSTRRPAIRRRSSPGRTPSPAGRSRSQEERRGAPRVRDSRTAGALSHGGGRRRDRQQHADRRRDRARLCSARRALDRDPLGGPERASSSMAVPRRTSTSRSSVSTVWTSKTTSSRRSRWCIRSPSRS